MKVDLITQHAMASLEKYSRDAICIRAAMAYWTIPAGDLPSAFLNGLKLEKSFLCVDLNYPTSISALESLSRNQVDVYLHLIQVTGKTEIRDSTGMPGHLMHSKIIVFDYKDRDPVIWVGSHNGTFRALYGINYECTLAIHVCADSKAYFDAVKYVEDIRSVCHLFNTDFLEHYRYLQSGKLDGMVDVIEFENGNDQPLVLGEEITIFNMGNEDSKKIKAINQEILVSLHGSFEILYKARVIQIGETPELGSQSFGPRRHADRHGLVLPVLLNTTDVSKNMFRRSTAFAVLKINEIVDSNHSLLEPPSTKGWEDVPTHALGSVQRPTVDNKYESIRKNHNIKGLSYKVPVFASLIHINDFNCISPVDEKAFKKLELKEKRVKRNRPLVSKKILSLS